MLPDRVLQARDAVEREEPDPEGEDVVLVQRLLEERVVGALVDVAVDALVEVDERALVGRVVHLLELLEQARRSPRGRPASPARPRLAALGSSVFRTSESPARSRTSTPETNIPRRGYTSTRRSRASAVASRTGVRPRPSRSMSSRSETSEPGGSSSVTISSRMR